MIKNKVLAITVIIILMASSLVIITSLNTPETMHAASPTFNSASAYKYTNENFPISVNKTKPGYYNYTINILMGAKNDTGLSPLSYHNFQKNSGNFTTKIRAPSKEENLYVFIRETAMNPKNKLTTIYSTETTYNISNPVTFNATIKTSSAPANNITVYFSVNGHSMGSSYISRIKANSSYNDNITVPGALVPRGKDLLNITTNNPSVTAPKATYFYYGHPPNYDWVYYISAAAIAFAIFIILVSGKRNTVKAPKWKRQKKTKKPKNNTK